MLFSNRFASLLILEPSNAVFVMLWNKLLLERPNWILLRTVAALTAYFPLLVPLCLLVEPSESESCASFDDFIDAKIAIQIELGMDH